MRPAVWMIILCLCFAFAPSEKAFAKDKKLTPEEVVSEHIKSISNPEVLSGIKSRVFVGDASVNFIAGNVGRLEGQCEFVSEDQKLGIFCRYNALDYPQEHFAFDGKDVTIGYISQGRRSPLGDFLNRNDSIVKSGLMGGVLSANWPLLDTESNRAKMKYKKKKVDGRELHELEYRPEKRMGEVKVKLYFDLDTFRHVKTEYKVNIRQLEDIRPATGGSRMAGRDTYIYYVLLEEFSDFREVDGMTLPHIYSLHYTREGGTGGTFMARWTIKALQWSHNTEINPQYYTAR
jgi:hypothetical protein